jgi:exodeoxyribonuclease V beta subunit
LGALKRVLPHQQPVDVDEQRVLEGVGRLGPFAVRAALQARRSHESRWRSTSFSALTRGLAGEGGYALPVPGSATDDRYGDAQLDNPQPEATAEPDVVPASGFAAFPAGAKYGDLLHGLLEAQLAAGWPILRNPADPAWIGHLRRRGELLGLDDAQQALLGEWIAAIARCPLGLEPRGPASTAVSLATLPAERTWAEMGFVITTRGVDAVAIDRLVQQQVLPGRPRDGLAPLALEGLLTGFLDLVFEQDGRYYVLDYKSNRLDRYTPEALADAILQHRYDLQYTLYLVALHRLLKVRLPGYDYDRHVGGAIYLFVRGIGSPGNGIYRDCPPRALIEALDAAFREAAP